jgi:hypothetical protein
VWGDVKEEAGREPDSQADGAGEEATKPICVSASSMPGRFAASIPSQLSGPSYPPNCSSLPVSWVSRVGVCPQC